MFTSLAHWTSPARRGLAWWDLSELGLVILGFLLYFLVRGAAQDATGMALENARNIIRLEATLGVFIEPHINVWAQESEPLRRIANFVYFWFDFPLIVGVGLFFFWWNRHWYTVLRDSLLLSGGIALVMYWLYPVAPPRYLPEWGFLDTLEAYSNLSYQAQSMQPFVNPFAAVPSLHVGWSMLLAYAVFGATSHPVPRIAVLVVFALQVLSVVATANHYIFDGVVGLIVCAVGLSLALWLQRVGYPHVRTQLALAASRVDAPSSADGPGPKRAS